MAEIDWSKAPEGATHYAHGSGDWVAAWYIVAAPTVAAMLDDGVDDEWEWRPIDQEDRAELIPRLVARPAPQWSGDGLPPVGTVCEVVQVSSQPNDYCRRFIGQNVKIVAHYVDVDGDEVAVFAASDYEFHALVAGCFRPIRTEAQIAAEEREKACEAMLEIAKSRRPDPDVYEAIAALYDAGYRKQEPKP